MAYHAGLVRTLRPQAMARAVRLFVAPGVEHGIGGPGPNRLGQWIGCDDDPERSLGAALRRWVEQGVMPEQVITVRYRYPNDPVSGLARSRRLRAWPKAAVYRGKATTKHNEEAQSFRCAE